MVLRRYWGKVEESNTNDSNEYLDFIKAKEGFRDTAYKPIDTEEHYTIGYGNYGQNVSFTIPQTKEQRDNGEKKRYVANGKIYYASDNLQSFVQKSEAKAEKATPVAADDLPF